MKSDVIVRNKKLCSLDPPLKGWDCASDLFNEKTQPCGAWRCPKIIVSNEACSKNCKKTPSKYFKLH